ncbi:hypothetical protein [Saccharomonospora saliphila]|uniref:hypothetical protein n=1 Tax=Saccharomonospora saliphila TaxID=369829 RepID=UPI00036F9FB9|nr:hypothetical protein [Saccharomonospora saliphila]
MADDTGKRQVKAFDVRMIIALLLGVYGIVLTVLGLGVTSEAEIAQSAGININLWAGLGMLIVAVAFVVWARVRPVVLPTSDEETTEAG